MSKEGSLEAPIPLEAARAALNAELFGKGYHPASVLEKMLKLESALLGSSLTPERVYHELSLAAVQGATLAKLNNDVSSESVFTIKSQNYDLTYQVILKGNGSMVQTNVGSDLSQLPPMVGMKGAEVKDSTKEKNAEAGAGSGDDSLNSAALDSSQKDQSRSNDAPKRRGRPRKSSSS